MDKRVAAIAASIALMVPCTSPRLHAQSPAAPQQTEQGAGTAQGGARDSGNRRGRMGRGMRRAMRRRGGPPMGAMFALIDTDNDGTISLQEWQAAHERIFKVMDTDNDGTVSLQEMRRFMAGRTRGAARQGGGTGQDRDMMRAMRGRGRGMAPMMGMMFALIDTDNDGTISLQEWQAAHERIFKAMDTDKEGTVSLQEMQRFMAGRTRSARQ